MKSVTSDANSADKTIMEEIQRYANAIHESIQVTIDYPSNNSSGKLPVLDLEQWIQVADTNDGAKYQLLHTHYMKPISSKHVINNASALSPSAKINILVADMLRIMRNVYRMCSDEKRRKHVQHFIHRLQFSGYSQAERVTVYQKEKRRYESILQSKTPMYRSKFWNRSKRMQEKKEKRKNWFRAGDCETVMIVECTPGAYLAKQYEKILKDYDLNIKVVEKAGKTLRANL